jgi:hypothetical protein
MREIHIELLLGAKVRDANGRVIGRIEEFVVEEDASGAHLVEVHLGSAAMLERLGGAMLKLPFLSKLARGREPKRIGWRELDLVDPGRPVLIQIPIG